ncbi:MAG: hypothetical protein SGBAC_011447, partial [Bacillariaceae sp.]
MAASSEEQQEGWKRLLSNFSQSEITGLECAESLRWLHRKAYGRVYRNQMNQRTFFLISVVAWMDSCNWLEGDEATGGVSVDLPSVLEDISRTQCMASWIIPSVTNIPNLGRAFDPKQAWIGFWMAYYDQCNEAVVAAPPKAKRIRLASPSSITELQDTRHGLPCTLLMIALLFKQQQQQQQSNPESWDQFHDLVFRSLSPWFKSTKEYTKAGLFLFGLHCIHSDTKIEGLNPLGLLQKYLVSLGFSPLIDATLQVYLEQQEGLTKYAIRASICQDLLETIYQSDGSDNTSDVQLINACSTFLSQESAKRYIASLSSPMKAAATAVRKRDRPTEIPSRIWSPGYPVLLQAELYLHQQREEEAIELASVLESTTHLDPVIVDEGWLTIFQHFFNEGNIFLDRNLVFSPEYCRKRKLLYFAAGEMGPLGRNTMFAFYLELHNEMLSSPIATPDEKHYVEIACQQTLLRLVITACGLSTSSTVDYFFTKTSHQWPSLVPPGYTDSKLQNMDQWVADFLISIPEIPESLKMQDASFGGQVDLRRFMTLLQDAERSVQEPFLIEVEESPALLLDESLPSNNDMASSVLLPPLATIAETEQPDSFQIQEEDETPLLDQSAMGKAANQEDEDSDGKLDVSIYVAQEEEDDDDESEEEIGQADDYSDEDNQGDSDVIVLEDTSEEEKEEISPESDQDEEKEDDIDVASTGDLYDKDSEADVLASRSLLPQDESPMDDEEGSRVEDGDDPTGSDEEDDDDDAGAAAMVVSTAPVEQYDDVDAENDEAVDSSPQKMLPGGEGKESVANLSLENKQADSDETEEIENEEDNDGDKGTPAARTDFGDTTEDEGDEKDTGAANEAAAKNRREDAMAAPTGYASQIEDGYEPEDTHDYTEEEVSEAMHTEDEEEDSQKREEAAPSTVQDHPAPIAPVKPVDHKASNSSDDMDADDEHTEQEEDLGAESSELEEHGDGPTPVKRYSPEPVRARGDTTTLWQFAQTAQRQHEETLNQDAKGKSVGFEEGTKMGGDDESKKKAKSEDSDYEDAEDGTESNTVYTTETAEAVPAGTSKDSDDDLTEKTDAPEDTGEIDSKSLGEMDVDFEAPAVPAESIDQPHDNKADSALDSNKGPVSVKVPSDVEPSNDTLAEAAMEDKAEEKIGRTELESPAKEIAEGLTAPSSNADEEAPTLENVNHIAPAVTEVVDDSENKISDTVKDPPNDNDEPNGDGAAEELNEARVLEESTETVAASITEPAYAHLVSAANDEVEALEQDKILATEETKEDPSEKGAEVSNETFEEDSAIPEAATVEEPDEGDDEGSNEDKKDAEVTNEAIEEDTSNLEPTSSEEPAEAAEDEHAGESVSVEAEIPEDAAEQMIIAKSSDSELDMIDVAEGDQDQVAMAESNVEDDEVLEDKMVEDEGDVQMGDAAALGDEMQVDDEAKSTGDIEMESDMADDEGDADMAEDTQDQAKIEDAAMMDTANLTERETADEAMNEQSMEE